MKFRCQWTHPFICLLSMAVSIGWIAELSRWDWDLTAHQLQNRLSVSLQKKLTVLVLLDLLVKEGKLALQNLILELFELCFERVNLQNNANQASTELLLSQLPRALGCEVVAWLLLSPCWCVNILVKVSRILTAFQKVVGAPILQNCAALVLA